MEHASRFLTLVADEIGRVVPPLVPERHYPAVDVLVGFSLRDRLDVTIFTVRGIWPTLENPPDTNVPHQYALKHIRYLLKNPSEVTAEGQRFLETWLGQYVSWAVLTILTDSAVLAFMDLPHEPVLLTYDPSTIPPTPIYTSNNPGVPYRRGSAPTIGSELVSGERR